MTWKTLGAVSADRLSEARLQLHWAAQLLSAPGVSLLPAADDYSHSNLGWDGKLGVLSGRNVGSESLRAGLVFEALELLVIDTERERSSGQSDCSAYRRGSRSAVQGELSVELWPHVVSSSAASGQVAAR